MPSSTTPRSIRLRLLGTGFSDAPIDNEVVDWTHTFSSNLLNDARFGVNYVKLHNGTDFDSSVGNLGDAARDRERERWWPGLARAGLQRWNSQQSGNGVLTNVGSSWSAAEIP